MILVHSLDVEKFLMGKLCFNLDWESYTCRNSSRKQLTTFKLRSVWRLLVSLSKHKASIMENDTKFSSTD